MEQATQVFMDYAAAFEETYVDDDWSRLAPFFSEDATYEVRGGPLACEIEGREAIFAGIKKSIDGLDRRCSDRKIDIIEAPQVVSTPQGQELSVGWHIDYQYGDAPLAGFDGRSVATIANGVIIALRDEYTEEEMAQWGAWAQEHGQDLGGTYV
jgi:hypothetical protein